MGGNGRDCMAASAGVDRAALRALASDVHAAFGTMRSKTPRGDGTDDLRYRRSRCCDRSAHACLRANFRALRGARVLGNGGPLCGRSSGRKIAPSTHTEVRLTHRWREADSNLYGAFPVKLYFWFVAGSLFGAGKPFFVPSPAIRFAERAEGVKGPKR